MAAVDQRARSTTPSRGQKTSRDNSLAAPANSTTSKGGISSSTTSIASSDGHGDGLQSAGDGTLDKFKSRTSDDGNSETSSHRRKMSRLFKGRRRRKSTAPDDLSQGDANEDVPPLPDSKPQSVQNVDPPFQSDESLGLHKSVASSLLTEDSDADA